MDLSNNLFRELNLPVPNLVYSYPEEKQREIAAYLKEMDEIQKKAYLIAIDHLQSSFNIYKSNGFKEWIKSKK